MKTEQSASNKPSPIFRNARGELLEAGHWYNFGGNVSVRFTAHGKMGKRYWTRLDTTGEAKPIGGGRPAARDAVEGALYNSICPVGYASYRYGAAFVAPGEEKPETPAEHAAAEKVLDKALGTGEYVARVLVDGQWTRITSGSRAECERASEETWNRTLHPTRVYDPEGNVHSEFET